MVRRPLAVPTKTISKADFAVLLAKWDARLARDGFRDIESGQDLNLISSSTFRGVSEVQEGRGGHGAEHVLGLPEMIADTTPNVFSSPRARAWTLFGQAAHELPTDARTRRILVAVAETGNKLEVSRRFRTSYDIVNGVVARLCAAIGIEQKNLFGTVTERGEFPQLGRTNWGSDGPRGPRKKVPWDNRKGGGRFQRTGRERISV